MCSRVQTADFKYDLQEIQRLSRKKRARKNSDWDHSWQVDYPGMRRVGFSLWEAKTGFEENQKPSEVQVEEAPVESGHVSSQQRSLKHYFQTRALDQYEQEEA